MIPIDDQKRLQPFLLPGERLLWTGRPKQGLLFRPSDLFIVAFGLVWTGLSLFAVHDDPVAVLGDVITWPFLAVGFYLIVGRFPHDAWLRSRLLYAVTNRRVIVLVGRPNQRLLSAEIGYLPALTYKEHPGGRGTLTFDVESSEPELPWLQPGKEAYTDLSRLRFAHIEQPRLVYDLIRRETERVRRELLGAEADSGSFIG